MRHNFGTSTPPNQFKLMSDSLYNVIDKKLDELNFQVHLSTTSNANTTMTRTIDTFTFAMTAKYLTHRRDDQHCKTAKANGQLTGAVSSRQVEQYDKSFAFITTKQRDTVIAKIAVN